MNRKQFDKMCKDVRADFEADSPDMEMRDAAPDMADSMLCDPELLTFCIKEFKTSNRQQLKEILADNIYG